MASVGTSPAPSYSLLPTPGSSRTRPQDRALAEGVVHLLPAMAAIAPLRAEGRAIESGSSARQVVIKHLLFRRPREREITLVGVVYPAGMRSPHHVHANGLMAFVISAPLHRKLAMSPNTCFMLARRGGNRKELSTASRAMRARRKRHTYLRFILHHQMPVKPI
jgi:hypothetical protein